MNHVLANTKASSLADAATRGFAPSPSTAPLPNTHAHSPMSFTQRGALMR